MSAGWVRSSLSSNNFLLFPLLARDMDPEGPVLARALSASSEARQFLLAIEAELIALVEAANSSSHPPGSGLAVAFPAGLGGYGRLLVHKTSERFDGLRSFSVGGHDHRRTLVLARPPCSPCLPPAPPLPPLPHWLRLCTLGAGAGGTNRPFLGYADFLEERQQQQHTSGDTRKRGNEEEGLCQGPAERRPGTRGAAPALYIPPARRRRQEVATPPPPCAGGGGWWSM